MRTQSELAKAWPNFVVSLGDAQFTCLGGRDINDLHALPLPLLIACLSSMEHEKGLSTDAWESIVKFKGWLGSSPDT